MGVDRRLMRSSLDNCVRRTLVNACAAVHAFVIVYDGDVINDNCVLRANVDACAASDTLIYDYFYHGAIPRSQVLWRNIISFALLYRRVVVGK